MPFDLPLTDPLRRQGWKIKIQDRERLEPPHVTIIFGISKWRVGLRDHRFLDEEPNPGEVPRELVKLIEDRWSDICDAWDVMYPKNPVAESENDDE